MSPEDREAFLSSPASTPPLGVKANFENAENAFHFAFPLFVGVFVLSNLVFGMKMYVQLRIVRRMHLEDYLLGLGWVSRHSTKV